MRLALLLLVALTAHARDIAARVDRYVHAQVAKSDFSGVVLLAQDGKKVLVSKGYGLANREHNVPNAPHTKFRLGSITKQFTAMAVLQLEEAGKLAVRDSICRYLDDCPETWQPITIHHLLTHTAGIFNFTSDPQYPRTWMLPSPPSKTMKRFRDRPPEFAPGSRFKYSNSGYTLLALIIERASGQPYRDFLRRSIFEPLGMNDTGQDSHADILKHRASGYSMFAAKVVHAPYHDMSIATGGGDLYSTAEDLYKWDQALYTGQLISRTALKRMFKPFKGGYAYGWRVDTHLGRKRLGHGGGINGFLTYLGRYPEERALLVVLCNTTPQPIEEIVNGLAAILFREPYQLPR
jgi:CubicO group peptidase (beta-lactamase class C family)